jgi:glucuronoarabinoxylan endo-1,4-beta-xylanase
MKQSRSALAKSVIVMSLCSTACSDSAPVDSSGNASTGSTSAASGESASSASGASVGSSTTTSGSSGGGGASASSAISSSASASSTTSTGAGGAPAGFATVDATDVHQTMDGFGASDRDDGDLPDDEISLFFDASNSAGIGLSILRTSIAPGGAPSNGDWTNLQKAQALGARIWAAPWTPPANWKTNGDTANGGDLLPAHYGDWAASLAGYVTTAASHGVTISGVSIQNEPDYTAAYDSCIYSTDEMVAFINVVGPLFAAMSPRPKLMMPETSSWSALWGFTSAVEASATAASFTDIYATHQYAGDPTQQSKAKPIWETEFSTFDGFNAAIDNGISVAQTIHQAIVTGGVQAWHYWWLIGLGTDNEGLIGQGSDAADHPTMTKRFYALGNFSKFIRPGFVRIGVANAPNGVSLSAYRDPKTSAFAIVAINPGAADASIGVFLNGLAASSVVPWVTSSALDLAPQTAIDASSGSFAADLAASSVTTFVGGAP